MLIAIFFFVSFVFYKVMPVLFFDIDTTVTSAALGAIASTILVFFATTATNLAQMEWLTIERRKRPFIEMRGLKYFGLCALVAFAANYLISYGFAKDLRRRILEDPYPEELIGLAIIFCTPIFVHYAILLFDARKLSSNCE